MLFRKKNQTAPNYMNHNESVSRGTLLPAKTPRHLRALSNGFHTHIIVLIPSHTHTNSSSPPFLHAVVAVYFCVTVSQ